MATQLVMADLEELCFCKKELLEIIEYSLKNNMRDLGKAIDVYEKLLHYFEIGKTNVWLAMEDKKVVGYAQFFQKEDGRVHLNQIAVAEKYQNKGVGSMLIDAVEKSAKDCGATIVELFCNEVNDNAWRFYDTHRYLTEKRLMIKKI